MRVTNFFKSRIRNCLEWWAKRKVEKLSVAQTFLKQYEFEPLIEADRVCLYSTFDPDSEVAAYVIEQLKYYRSKGFKILFLSTSPEITLATLDLLKEYTSCVIHRKNHGLDFCSWKLALDCYPSLYSCKELFLTNDSIFGPLNDFWKSVAVKKNEILGMTDSFQNTHHLQSYFLLLGQDVIRSREFKAFIDGIRVLYRKFDIINELEIRFSKEMEKYFLLRAIYPYKEIFSRYSDSPNHEFRDSNDKLFDPTIAFWHLLLSDGFPFLKRSLLSTNPLGSKKIHMWFSFIPQDNWQGIISAYIKNKRIPVVF